MSIDYDNKPDINFCPTVDTEDKNLSSSQHLHERQLSCQPDDISSYDIETMRRMMVDMIQDLNMMTDSTYNNGSDIIESSFSKSTSYQPMSIPKSYPNHKESTAQHFNSGGDHKLLALPVSRRLSMRSLSIPLFVECSNEYSSNMTYECNDDDDVLSASHLSVVHADAGYEGHLSNFSKWSITFARAHQISLSIIVSRRSVVNTIGR
jgi:hypothetical protein